jgi:hypothetical protein
MLRVVGLFVRPIFDVNGFFFVTCRAGAAGAAGESRVLDASFRVDISRMPPHVYEPRTRGVLFHVTGSCERYQAPELAHSKSGGKTLLLLGETPDAQVFGRKKVDGPVGTVSRVCSFRRHASTALTRSLCTDSWLPDITMSLQRVFVVFDYFPCIWSQKGFCGV